MHSFEPFLSALMNSNELKAAELESLAERLREHADLHDAHIPKDSEQRQWADDLRTAAKMIAALRDTQHKKMLPGPPDVGA